MANITVKQYKNLQMWVSNNLLEVCRSRNYKNFYNYIYEIIEIIEKNNVDVTKLIDDYKIEALNYIQNIKHQRNYELYSYDRLKTIIKHLNNFNCLADKNINKIFKINYIDETKSIEYNALMYSIANIVLDLCNEKS